MPGADKVIQNLRGWADRKKAATIALAQNWAGTLEGQMKREQSQGRYWINRSHKALLGLRGEAVVSRNVVRIVLAHSMEYGIFLELCNDGKHAILAPTLNAAAAEILDSYRKVWGD